MSWARLSDDEDELGTTQEREPNYGRAGITFLIDCSRTMFVKDLTLHECDTSDGVNCSAFSLALQCCRETMIQKIKSEGKTMISVVFFGVEKGDSTRKYVWEFQPLSEPNASNIKVIDRLLASNSHNDFDNKYGHSDDAHLAEVLSACIFSFNGCSFKLGSKRILLFTKNDNPDGDYQDRQHQIRKRGNDLREADVDLELIPIGAQFDSGKFYGEIIQTIKKDNFHIVNPIEGVTYLQDVLQLVNKEHHKKRTLARLRFHVGNQVVMGVGLYGFTCKNRFIKKVSLCRKSNEQVRPVRQLMAAETSAPLRPYEVVKTTSVASKDVAFSTDELSKMRKVFEPSIVLLGFKPQDAWKVEHQCHAPVLMFPDESVVKGSSQLFKALLNRCVARNMVAVCAVTTRVGSRPKYALLVPQEEVVSDDGSQQITPAGFLIYYLPFARMFGQIPVQSDQPKVDQDKMQLVSKLIRKMKVKNFTTDFFENPSLTKQWINIEALALQHDTPKEFVDTTLIYMEKLGDRLKDLAIEFNETFFTSGNTLLATKRKLPLSDSSGPSKLMKTNDVINLIAERKVDKLTVAQLKDVLKCLPNVHLSQLKKGDLVELVYSNVEAIKKFL